jgi:hypothetical protein
VMEKKNRRAVTMLLMLGGRMPGVGQVQLVAAQILGRGRLGRSAEEGGELLDVSDIILLRLLDELAHRHVFDHVPGATG